MHNLLTSVTQELWICALKWKSMCATISEGGTSNQSFGSSAQVVSRWLGPGNRTFLEVVSWWIVAFCPVILTTEVWGEYISNDLDLISTVPRSRPTVGCAVSTGVLQIMIPTAISWVMIQLKPMKREAYRSVGVGWSVCEEDSMTTRATFSVVEWVIVTVDYSFTQVSNVVLVAVILYWNTVSST